MKEKIFQIRKALEAEVYLPALALALTLPDICGQIEYPKEKVVGTRYINWFNNWVAHYYADHTGWNENGKKPKNPYLDGEICYKLRCAYLHDGKSDINYNFSLVINGCDSYGYDYRDSDEKEIKTRTINVEELCQNICSSAEKYYKEKEGKGFEEHHIVMPNIKEEVEKIEKINRKDKA